MPGVLGGGEAGQTPASLAALKRQMIPNLPPGVVARGGGGTGEGMSGVGGVPPMPGYNASGDTSDPMHRGLVAEGGTYDPRTGSTSYSYGNSAKTAKDAAAAKDAAMMAAEVRQHQYETETEARHVKINQDAEQRRMASMQALLAQFGGEDSSGSGGHQPPIDAAGDAAERVGQDAVFARAKDQAGQTARSSITALRENMADRGLLGSGIEAEQTGQAVLGGANTLGEVTREQQIQSGKRVSEVADRNFAAAEARRQAKLAMIPSLLSLFKQSGSLY